MFLVEGIHPLSSQLARNSVDERTLSGTLQGPTLHCHSLLHNPQQILVFSCFGYVMIDFTFIFGFGLLLMIPHRTPRSRMAQPRYQPLMQLPSLLAQPPQQQLLWAPEQLSSLDHWGYFSVGSIYSNSRRLELWAGRFIRSDLFMYIVIFYIYIYTAQNLHSKHDNHMGA